MSATTTVPQQEGPTPSPPSKKPAGAPGSSAAEICRRRARELQEEAGQHFGTTAERFLMFAACELRLAAQDIEKELNKEEA
jgi:hypothetical protein